MPDGLIRSFTVLFTAPQDPAVVEWLEQLEKLLGRLSAPELAAISRCDQMSHKTLHDVVTHETVLDFMRARQHHDVVSRRREIADRMMQQLFELRRRIGHPQIRVRFYCFAYGHPAGECRCVGVVNRHAPAGSEAVWYRPLTQEGRARYWVIDRSDLLALTPEQIEHIAAHSSTRERLTAFVQWLREQEREPASL